MSTRKCFIEILAQRKNNDNLTLNDNNDYENGLFVANCVWTLINEFHPHCYYIFFVVVALLVPFRRTAITIFTAAFATVTVCNEDILCHIFATS